MEDCRSCELTAGSKDLGKQNWASRATRQITDVSMAKKPSGQQMLIKLEERM